MPTQVAVATGRQTVSPAREAQEQRFRRALLLAVALTASYLCWLISGLGSDDARVALSDLVFVAAPLVGAWTCWAAHRMRAGRHSGWGWLAVGCLMWAAASLVWAFYEQVLHEQSPFPSYADIGYIGYALPVAVGITRFARAPSNVWSRWRLTLDAMVMAGCLMLAVSVWVLAPAVDHAPDDLSGLVAAAYPLADVTVAAVILTRSMVFPRSRRLVWFLLSAGLLVLAVTDSVYIRLRFHEKNGFAPGDVVDLGWLVSFVLVALAALTPVDDPAKPPVSAWPSAGDPPTMLQQLLPHVTVALALVAVVVDPQVLGDHKAVFWLAVPLALLICVREVVVVADHVALARHLVEEVEDRTGELQLREQFWRDLVQNLTDVVVVIDTRGTILYCSPSARSALGTWPQLAEHAYDLLAHLHPDDHDLLLDIFRPVLSGKRRTGFVECRIERADGSWGWFEVSAVGQLHEQALDGTVLTLHDVSERKRLTDQLTHEAHHDSLTGLPNRALLMKRIEEALVRRTRQRAALLLIDLDDFKVINDRHGHAAGDLVLEVIGRRLRGAVREDDTVARLGGDEFALLMRGSADQVRNAAGRLIAQIEEPVVAGGRKFLVRASVGVVFAAEDEHETAHSLLSHADIALYEAKARGKGGTVVIEGHERQAAAKKVHLREQIAQPALEQFSVAYQPIVDVVDGRIRGVEALLRWNHPDLGSVPPDEFIPMAEAGGSIQRLGWHVLEQSCLQLVRWREEAPDHRLAVGVNVSSRQLDEPGFAGRVLALLQEHGIEPELIVMELTEQSLARDFETAVAVVAELRAGGVSVAVDDYGTGYSSLSYLHRFDADVVKIDRSFVANLEGSVHTQKIVRSVMDMAVALDLQSIAEGIETQAQLELVRELGCELGQGYLFSRPVSAEEISALIVSGHDYAAATVVRPGVADSPTRTVRHA